MAFPTIPTVAAGRVLTTNQADASGTRTFPDLSGLTKNSGDLLIAIAIGYQSGGSSGAVFSAWGASFTELPAGGDQMTTLMCVGIAYKFSTGSETGTFTVTVADRARDPDPALHPRCPRHHAARGGHYGQRDEYGGTVERARPGRVGLGRHALDIARRFGYDERQRDLDRDGVTRRLAAAIGFALAAGLLGGPVAANPCPLDLEP